MFINFLQKKLYFYLSADKDFQIWFEDGFHFVDFDLSKENSILKLVSSKKMGFLNPNTPRPSESEGAV